MGMANTIGGHIDFWYDLSSSYSYPAAMRIEGLAAEAGIAVNWRPFLLGPIFKAQGWDTSPFNLQPAKGRYMWRDLERICAGFGLEFRKPDPFPQWSLAAARMALTDIVTPVRPEFTKRVFLAQFAEGKRIEDTAILSAIAADLGLDGELAVTQLRRPEIKEKLRAETDEAQRLGLFGAPSFVTPDGEIFWGNDRLEAALSWAARLD
jgi:2-hydroxychromene-2-carboxylate isomerase